MAAAALAKSFTDEMGNGNPAVVHAVLHDRLVAALALPNRPGRAALATLERAALTGLVATNRYLQPELIGPSACWSCGPGRAGRAAGWG